MDAIQRDQVRKRLSHARESLDEAKFLLHESADPSFVMNNLYYTFLYPVLGLLQSLQIPAPMQSTAISLFDREYVQTGIFENRFLDAFRKAFDLRPACECQKTIAAADIEELLPIAQDFLDAVEKNIQ
jgi:uncharacterized protein (UPF0332 family)